jgi:alginate O-acetyltransferase complex protein AlgI
MITMLLGGLWHGAALIASLYASIKYTKNTYPPPPPTVKYVFAVKILSFIKYLFANLFTNIFVCFCWILFRADSFSTASQIITRIVTWQDGIVKIYSWVVVAVLVLLFATMITIVKTYKNKSKEINGFYIVLDLSKIWQLVMFFLFIGLIIGLAFVGANPFIYFQF